MTNAYMTMDLQFGSSGKGLLAGYLATTKKPDTIVTAWGPNAGHTYISSSGRKFVHRMLANGIVSPNLKRLLIGPGSVIDTTILLMELNNCRDLLQGCVLIVHPNAMILNASHAEAERENLVSIGGTLKGNGAANMERIWRDPSNICVASNKFPAEVSGAIKELGIEFYIDSLAYAHAIDESRLIQIEGSQGHSLSIYHGLYPFTTCRDVSTAQVMSDCAIPYKIVPLVYGTMRTYPIRVANRYDDEGEMIGTSGPCYPDQAETTWEELGLEVEFTTVTKLPRRVFTFSFYQVSDAVRQCGVDKLFLNFANYVDKEDLVEICANIQETTGLPISLFGLGPAHNDIVTDLDDALEGLKGRESRPDEVPEELEEVEPC